MLFRRRHRPHPLKVAKELLWPSAGWGRTLAYTRHRLARLQGSPARIAAGFACGAAVSFTPFLGLHLVGAIVMAWALGVNPLAAAIGTAVGNPWTFPFIWLWTYRLGAWILGIGGGFSALHAMSVRQIFADPVGILGPVILPMAVGGVLTGALAWWISFWITRRIVAGYQERRRQRMDSRRDTRAREKAQQRLRDRENGPGSTP